MRQLDVMAVGELNVDLILNQIDGFPQIGKEIIAGNMDMTLGSSTAIFAANLSSLGVKMGFIGKIGDDNFGNLVTKSLKNKGIDTSWLIVEKQAATGATIILNYAEDRAMVTFPGAMEQLTINDIKDEDLAVARHIHFSSYFLQPGIKQDVHHLFKRAKDMGLSTSLDTQWDPAEQWDFDFTLILPYVDVFLPNEAELLHIAGEDSLEAAIRKVTPYGNHLVVKRGNKGAVMHAKNGDRYEQPAYLNTDVVDAIGAGDSFNAGFIYSYIQGLPLTECLDFGILMGALNTTAAGGTGAFVSKKIITETLLARFNVSIQL